MALRKSPYGSIDRLPQSIQEKIKQLQELQLKYDLENAQYLKGLSKLQYKYQEKYDPILNKRSEIVSGESIQQDPCEGIPNFWLNVLNKSLEIKEIIEEYDKKILENLIDIRSFDFGVSHTDDNAERGYRLKFKFKPNDYFKETEVEKVYFFRDSDFTLIDKTVSTPITWNPDKCPIKSKSKPPLRQNSNVSNLYDQKKTAQSGSESFFNFFNSYKVPEMTQDSEKYNEEVFEKIERDVEYGEQIKMMIPNAVKWYTGELTDEDEIDDFDLENVDDPRLLMESN